MTTKHLSQDTVLPPDEDSVLHRLGRSRILRVVVRGLVVALAVATIAFSVLRFAPGDPVLTILGDQATPEAVEALRDQLGLGGNFFTQYATFLGDAVRGDLGRSIVSGTPVSSIIAQSIVPTVSLVVLTGLMAFVMAVPVGLILAIRPYGWFSQLFRVVSSFFLSMPGFLLGLLALLYFAIRLGIAPVAGFKPGFPDALNYLWLPSLVICAQLVPILSRVLRASVSRTLGEEFVEVAIVKGVRARPFYWNHLIRPSIASTVALLGYIMGQLLGASVMIELVFDIPGIGTRLVQAVTARDYPTVQGIIMVFGVIVVFITTLSEILIGYLDPRAAQ